MQIWANTINNIIIPKLQSVPLGRWERQTHQQWHYFTNARKEFLTHNNTSFSPCHHLRRSRYKQNIDYHKGSWVADVTKCTNGDLICESHANLPSLPTPISEESSLVETFTSIRDWRKRNWGNVAISVEKLINLREQLKNQNVSAACDGTVAGSKSAHAWCLLRTDTGEIIIQGCAPVDGIADTMTSTRTEIMGLLAVTTFLAWYSKTYFKIDFPIKIYSDRKSAIDSTNTRGLRSTKYALYNDIDCIMELQHIIKRNPLFQLNHVHGHQDRK